MADYEVAISGMSGSFPECSNISELENKIFTDENLVTEVTDPKWTEYEINVPLYTGKMKDPLKFDQTFFGIHRKLALVMDVNARQSLEKTFEAICDAGFNPEDIAGTNAAVIMTTMISETEFGSVSMSKSSGYAMVGHSRSMQGNRISYFFNLTGPSIVLNSSWTGAMQGLQIASNLVAKGQVKLAIVGATNIMYKPEVSVHFDQLGLLNADGKTKSFSADADGYSRSAGVVVFVVQRAQDALRSYGSIVKVLTATEMNHPHPCIDKAGFPSFINDFYSDLHIKNSDIGYIEGDGSASLKLDAMELNGYASILCSGRKEPLPVGCVKSRLGHAESSAAFMSIVNALIAFKSGYIPPCLNFSSPNPLVPALFDGRMKIVTEKTPLEGDLIGVTNFGIGSMFAHVLLKRNPRACPTKISNNPPEGIPRLFILSGRDEDGMKEILTKISEKPVDEHFYALNHHLFKTNFPMHLCRGYSVIGDGLKSVAVTPYNAGAHRPVWYILSGMGSQWNTMGTGLLEIPVIRRAIEKCHNVLLPKGLDLIEIITSTDPANYENILHSFVGIAAIQVGLLDLLEELGVKADGIIGHSVGELGCSYADKCLTAEQIILAAYSRGKASNDAKLIKGMMAAVGKGYAQIKNELPEGIEVACHNSKTSCTLSGPTDIMEKYVKELQSKGVFARLVNVSNIAYHSKNITPAAPFLLKYLKEIIPEPKLRSSKWISSSVPESQWETDLAKYCSAEYHTNNLLSYVLFEEATAHIPNDAICIEIAPHGLLQAILKKSLPTCSHVPLTNRAKHGCSFLVEALGILFKSGLQMDLTKLYPPVKYPLPRETDYNTCITWSHTERLVPLALVYEEYKCTRPLYWKKFTFRANEDIDLKSNHIIRGNSYFLKSTILKYFMDTLRKHIEADSMTLKCFAFKDITFHQDLRFYKQDVTPTVETLFQIGAGAFEALNKHEKIISGFLTNELTLPKPGLDSDFATSQVKRINMSENQIYEFFEANDCLFNGPLRSISGITIFEKGFAGNIKWRGSSELYFDAIFKLLEFYSSFHKDELMELDRISQFFYDPSVMPENDEDIDVYYNENLGYLCAKGVRLLLFNSKPSQHEIEGGIYMNNLQFTPYSKLDAKINFAEICLQIFRENTPAQRLVLDLIMDKNSPLCSYIVDLIKIKTFNDNYEIKLRPRKEVFDISVEKGSTDCYLVVAENGHFEQLNKLIKNNIQFYFINTGSQVALEKNFPMEHLTPIIEQELNGQRVVLYKQRNATYEDSVFIQMPGDNFVKEAETVHDVRANKTYFLIFKYRILSDVINIPQSSFYCPENNKRFVFIDESSPPFDQNDTFFKEQLAKDLKINIAFRRIWGSIRDQEIDERSRNVFDCIGLEATLNEIRCQTVDLKVIGINLQSVMFPNKYKKLSVIEYSGIIGDEEVFGLGKLTNDNYLEVDAQLCWKKPSYWSFEDAATVPFYYTMAYHLLYMKGRSTNRPYQTVLIHGGHTPFAQALFSVAVGMDTEIFTTCFTQEQKSFILERFPQIKEGNVLIIVGEHHKTFLTYIMDSTNGEGAKLVIDALEDNELRNITFHCTGEYGSYFFFTNQDMETNHTFGLNIFLTQVALFGYNPELIFNLKEEEKLRLSSLMATGMKMHVVKPLDSRCISNNITSDEAANIVVSECRNVIPRKIIMPIKKLPLESQPTKEIPKKKCYMIVGTYNCLWFDLLTWLVSNGADAIHVVLNEDEISQCLKGRFDNFINKHKYINVEFSGTQSLNSAQTCNNLIMSVQVENDIDVLFYLKPGFEKQMTNVDYALRLHSKSSCLVSIGLQACRVVERRLCDRFRGVSFMLTKSSLRNWMVVNALDKWSKKCDENDSFVSVAKSKRREIDLTDKNEDILPSNCYELVALQSNILEKPCFVEMTTRCVKSTYAKDINPVFMFPGLKLAHLEKLTTQLLYPVYMAQYPLVIKSLNDIAIPFSEMLVDMFNYSMFTLIAEGWAGPLVLTIAKILENQGKVCEIILLDGSPETIMQWNRRLDKSDSILTKYMPSIKIGEHVSISDIRNWSTKLSQVIIKEEANGFTEGEIYTGFKTLVNRLDVIQNYSYKNQTLESVIHLFTEKKIDQDVNDLKKICNSRFYHRIIKPSNSTFLENSKLIQCVNELPLVEHKMSAKMPKIKDIATSYLIADVGIYSQEDEQDI